ncbi:cell division protein FtsX [Paenibacillus radicis (ex Xue et al. 2023)]|uniref:Cell division protein FtsX n=1 Tax=Paenibacillus radicis (ex Xue et al. 2023) TaxID=2972489 RepID=A0ABT1YES7_9BACL|nr:permease-like cell division protein FtsX [Paenibacillus radicis (ex Xue et al. 2023)]MCR8631671.1 permease-like cell division protein FtsX [Paenibacillus radicis (ex Xue et al. 2023)]
MNLLNYYIRDAREGIRRNMGAAAAAAALIFIAMTIAGILFLVRFGAGDLMRYLDSQVSVKAYLEPSVDSSEVARILQRNSYVKSVEIETKEQMLDRLSVFFQGREHLLSAFKESAIPDAVHLKLTDNKNASKIAGELRSIQGITEVIYPQQFAAALESGSDYVNRYGMALLLFFVIISYLTVYIAINLALFQREKEIRVKLLLGAKPLHVRGQFLFEGGLTGFMGSLMSVLALYLLYSYMLFPLQHQFPFIFTFSMNMLYGTMVGIIAAGTAVSLSAAYFSTRKLIGYA